MRNFMSNAGFMNRMASASPFWLASTALIAGAFGLAAAVGFGLNQAAPALYGAVGGLGAQPMDARRASMLVMEARGAGISAVATALPPDLRSPVLRPELPNWIAPPSDGFGDIRAGRRFAAGTAQPELTEQGIRDAEARVRQELDRIRTGRSGADSIPPSEAETLDRQLEDLGSALVAGYDLDHPPGWIVYNRMMLAVAGGERSDQVYELASGLRDRYSCRLASSDPAFRNLSSCQVPKATAAGKQSGQAKAGTSSSVSADRRDPALPTRESRERAKGLVIGLTYLMGVYKLQTGSPAEALEQFELIDDDAGVLLASDPLIVGSGPGQSNIKRWTLVGGQHLIDLNWNSVRENRLAAEIAVANGGWGHVRSDDAFSAASRYLRVERALPVNGGVEAPDALERVLARALFAASTSQQLARLHADVLEFSTRPSMQRAGVASICFLSSQGQAEEAACNDRFSVFLESDGQRAYPSVAVARLLARLRHLTAKAVGAGGLRPIAGGEIDLDYELLAREKSKSIEGDFRKLCMMLWPLERSEGPAFRDQCQPTNARDIMWTRPGSWGIGAIALLYWIIAILTGLLVLRAILIVVRAAGAREDLHVFDRQQVDLKNAVNETKENLGKARDLAEQARRGSPSGPDNGSHYPVPPPKIDPQTLRMNSEVVSSVAAILQASAPKNRFQASAPKNRD